MLFSTVFFSGGRRGVFHLLGPVPRAKADRHIRVQSHVLRQRRRHPVRAPAVRHLNIRVRRALLSFHHGQPNTVPHHVAEIPYRFQGMYIICTPAAVSV